MHSFFFFNFYFMCIGVLLGMYIYVKVSSPGTVVTGSCELPCGWWESNLGPPDQPVLLNTDPSLQLLNALILTTLDGNSNS